MNNYIVGYGSLIDSESRLRTTPNITEVFPVQIKGFVRGWWGRTNTIGLSTTYLGCIQVSKENENYFSCDYLNGVIYKVSDEELTLTDVREQGYTRIEIPRTNIIDYENILVEECHVWIYSNKFSNDTHFNDSLPSVKFPIVQSYVDICINGCIEIEGLFSHAKEDNFIADFIRSTQRWSQFWVNDRVYPRRPFIYRKNAYDIDKFLFENLEDKSLFEKIIIGNK